MKAVLFLSILTMTSAFAAEWKVVAVTQNCPEQVQILAKPGAKYVIAAHDNTTEKLISKDGSEFTNDSMSTTEFVSDTFSYRHPSVVEANPPKLDVKEDGRKSHCRMIAK